MDTGTKVIGSARLDGSSVTSTGAMSQLFDWSHVHDSTDFLLAYRELAATVVGRYVVVELEK